MIDERMNLLLTGAFVYTDGQIEKLAGLGYRIHFMQQEADGLPLPASEVDAVVCNGLFLHHDIEAFSRLRCIQLTSAGFDRVPRTRIEVRGIELHNAKGVYSAPMAEWALFRLLERYKCASHFRDAQNAGKWLKDRNLREIAGTKIAVIGAGNVGQEVAKRFGACEAEITGFDIHTHATPGFDAMRPIETLEAAVGEFDTVVVTAPLTEGTYHLLSERVLRNLKRGATLIDIAGERLSMKRHSAGYWPNGPTSMPRWTYSKTSRSPKKALCGDCPMSSYLLTTLSYRTATRHACSRYYTKT